MMGVLTYFLYIGITYTFSVVFNSLFLVYTALFSASLFATLIAFTTLDAQSLASKVNPGLPYRGIAIFMFVAGLGTLMLWLSELIGPLMTGQAPANLGPYTTMFTHGFDSAIITPATVITGIYLLKRKPLGYLFAAPLLLLCTNIGVVVIAQTISQTLAGFVFPIGVYIGMIGSWVVMGAFAIGLAVQFFRNLSETTQ
jgi:NADH:ubiquinone oxidoreductase subunit K